MKFRLFLGFFIALGVSSALAGAIKVWVSGETLTSSDLNSNFAHIHNTMVGGHGARLVDSDVSTSAAISHSKLAAPALVPRAWAVVSPTCGATPCTVVASSGVASVGWNSAGNYYVNLSVARLDGNYAVFVTSFYSGAARLCTGNSNGISSISVTCFSLAGAAADTGFQVMILDDN